MMYTVDLHFDHSQAWNRLRLRIQASGRKGAAHKAGVRGIFAIISICTNWIEYIGTANTARILKPYSRVMGKFVDFL